MPTVKSLQRVKHVVFEWPDSDEALNMKVYPDQFTGQTLEDLQTGLAEDAKDTAQHMFLCEFLSNLVGEWDLTDDDGTVIPLTGPSLFKSVPVTLVAALLDRIKSELTVNPPTPES